MSYPLQTQTVTLDAAGTGRVEVGPSVYGVTWHVTLMVTTSDSVLSPTLRVYRNTVTDGAIVDQTLLGGGDVSDCDLTLTAGQRLVARWTGGTPGAHATFNIEGEEKRGRA